MKINGDFVKERINQIVGTDWVDFAIVVAAVLSTRKLKLPCNEQGARTVAAYIYELRITGVLEARTIDHATGFNQVRRKPSPDGTA